MVILHGGVQLAVHQRSYRLMRLFSSSRSSSTTGANTCLISTDLDISVCLVPLHALIRHIR